MPEAPARRSNDMENLTGVSAPSLVDTGLTIEKRSTAAERMKTSAVNEKSEIQVLAPCDYKEAALCLAEAFVEDKVVRYVIDTPDRADWSEEEKWKLHLEVLEYITYAHCLKGMVTTIGPNHDCVALWMPPGKSMDDTLTVLRSGMWRLAYKLSAEGKTRFFKEFLPLLHDAKHDVLGPRDPHSWYLVYIGTKAASRGRGYARRLIEHVTKKCDEEGRACYLESSNDLNPVIYRKLGFEVTRRIYLERAPEGRIEMDLMVREPVGSGAGE